jgi:hypothetical protein
LFVRVLDVRISVDFFHCLERYLVNTIRTMNISHRTCGCRNGAANKPIRQRAYSSITQNSKVKLVQVIEIDRLSSMVLLETIEHG